MHLIDEKLLMATIQYLAARPYAEVYQLIPALQGTPEAPKEEAEEAAEAAEATAPEKTDKAEDDAASTV